MYERQPFWAILSDKAAGQSVIERSTMGLMDKVKAQATQLAQKTQETARDSKAKFDQAQGKRHGDAMLRDLGALVYAERTGRGTPESQEQVDKLVADISTFEAENGINLASQPADQPADDSPGAASADPPGAPASRYPSSPDPAAGFGSVPPSRYPAAATPAAASPAAPPPAADFAATPAAASPAAPPPAADFGAPPAGSPAAPPPAADFGAPPAGSPAAPPPAADFGAPPAAAYPSAAEPPEADSQQG
jgi:hypothetical protein